ncbi:hypothetical protein FB45DRAFT_904542 [Roridomyces roridus]|uniref:Uncharacterized protein n=1 Tax=Roridomyces roridus TaxID=1738132 RepID=A0AAD7C4Z3_9AGAR|nr:hypothetical protein FB45DRAFT_904542 [Roridomyces roridus]
MVGWPRCEGPSWVTRIFVAEAWPKCARRVHTRITRSPRTAHTQSLALIDETLAHLLSSVRSIRSHALPRHDLWVRAPRPDILAPVVVGSSDSLLLLLVDLRIPPTLISPLVDALLPVDLARAHLESPHNGGRLGGDIFIHDHICRLPYLYLGTVFSVYLLLIRFV